MLILSPVFVSLLQSQIIAFAVRCRSFTPSLWTERSLNKSQNRQFTIITMYQVTFNPNSSRRTTYIRCFPPQWKCNFLRKTAGINNHIAMLKSDKLSPIWFIIRRTDKISEIRHFLVGLSDLLQTLHSVVGNNTRPFQTVSHSRTLLFNGY